MVGASFLDSYEQLNPYTHGETRHLSFRSPVAPSEAFFSAVDCIVSYGSIAIVLIRPLERSDHVWTVWPKEKEARSS